MTATLTVFFDFHRGQAFLLVYDLILHAIFLLVLKAIEFLLLFVLLLHDLRLLALLASRLEDSLLYLALFVSALLIQGVVVVGVHALMLILHLVVVDFLYRHGERRR